MLQILDFPQGGPEWFAARLGLPTASSFSKVLAGGEGKTRKAYMLQLAAEILTGQSVEGFSSAAMEHGKEHEAGARAAYELMNDCTVDLVGLCKNYGAGASPDGLVGDRGLIEIKCPNTTTHRETLLSGRVPTGHIPQIQGQLWITERDWCDFVSYDPRIKSASQYFCKRVMRDETYITNKLAPAVALFLADLEKLINQVEVAT